MRQRMRVICILVGLFALATSVMAQKARKLPEGAYLKTAKIEILSGEQERYKIAVAMLDSLFMYYGPHAEGLYLMAQIQVDGIKVSSEPKTKAPFVMALVAYRDSLKMCCASKTVKDKYKEGCDKFSSLLDSIIVLHWRQFYNDGVVQLNSAAEAMTTLSTEKDSTVREFEIKKMNATLDTCAANMTLALALDTSSALTYDALASVYELKKDYAASIEWQEKSIAHSKEPGNLLLRMASNYVQMKKFCDAISPYRRYLQLFPSDTNAMSDIAVCFANCGTIDSLVPTYRRILGISASHHDALVGLGGYYNQLARNATDSAKKYKDAGKEADSKKWDQAKTDAFDSSRVYFKRAFESKPDDQFAAQQYGLVSYLLGKYEESLTPYQKLTELNPKDADSWTSVGDICVYLKKFDEAAGAYEKVVGLDAGNRQIWQRLYDIYGELGKKDKQADAGKHLK